MSPPSQFCGCVATAQLSVVVEYLVLQLGEETAVQSVVGSIVWAFRRLKKPRSREMSTRGYALLTYVLHVCTQLFLFPFLISLSDCRFVYVDRWFIITVMEVAVWPCRWDVVYKLQNSSNNVFYSALLLNYNLHIDSTADGYRFNSWWLSIQQLMVIHSTADGYPLNSWWLSTQ